MEGTHIEDDGRIALSADALRELGWKPGDELFVHRSANKVTLMREPVDWVETYSGKMDHVWGSHEDVLRYLDEERESADRSLV